MMPPTPVVISDLMTRPAFRSDVAEAWAAFRDALTTKLRVEAEYGNRPGNLGLDSYREVRQARADARMALEFFGSLYAYQVADELSTELERDAVRQRPPQERR